MNNSIQNIKDRTGFVSVLRELNDASEELDLIQHLKILKTKDEALQGAILFLEDCNWDFDLLKERLFSAENRIKTIQKQSKKNKLSWKVARYWTAAAVLIPLIYFSLHKWSSNSSSIDDYLLSEPGLPNFMANNEIDKWNDAMAFFKQNDYQKALDAFNMMYDEQKNDTLIYFSGVTNYYLGNFQDARRQFEKIASFENSSFQFDAEFRSGFVLFQLGKNEEASNHFRRIASENGHPFEEESKTVLEAFFGENNK